MKLLKFLVMGAFFGVVLVKSEVASWFRIQKMFRFEEAHMYLIIGAGVIVGIASVAIIKRYRVKTAAGAEIVIPPKRFHLGNIFGGMLFGMGWIITGGCPGPMFAQLGVGELMAGVTIIGALLGTICYSFLRPYLPH